MPALPLDEAGKYVAAAYLVFLALLLIYVAIMAAKLQRIDRELGELADHAEGKAARARDEVPVQASEPAAAPAPETDGDVAEGEASGGIVQASDEVERPAAGPVATAQGGVAGTRDEIPVQAAGPAARLAPEPAGDAAEGEASGGGIQQ